jgi:hypothetical protein
MDYRNGLELVFCFEFSLSDNAAAAAAIMLE